jgi:effector-binding domain-containing protein
MTVDQIPIGRFSAATRLTQKALRYYDEKGILVPEAKDSITGYRYYTGSQIAVAIRIKTLTSLGLTLEETADFVEAENHGDRERTDRILRSHLDRTREDIRRLEEVAAMLSNHTTEEVLRMTLSEPAVKEVPAMRVICKREKGTYTATVPKLIGEVAACLYSPDNQRNFVKALGPPMTIYHDECYKEEDADIEVAIPVSGKVTLPEGIEVRSIPAGRAAYLIHKGSYETLSPAYGRLFDFVVKSKLEAAGPLMDVYLSDPAATPKDQNMTEIRLPVK